MLKRNIWIGVGLWVAYCAVMIPLRGIWWDEDLDALRQDRAMIHVAASAFILAVVILPGALQWRDHEPIRRKPFDTQVVEYLREHGQEDALLLTPNYEPYPQARLNHPILVHWQTAGYITYMPWLGPRLRMMYDDLYNIPFGVSPTYGHENQPRTWQRAWKKRPRHEMDPPRPPVQC